MLVVNVTSLLLFCVTFFPLFASRDIIVTDKVNFQSLYLFVLKVVQQWMPWWCRGRFWARFQGWLPVWKLLWRWSTANLPGQQGVTQEMVFTLTSRWTDTFLFLSLHLWNLIKDHFTCCLQEISQVRCLLADSGKLISHLWTMQNLLICTIHFESVLSLHGTLLYVNYC